jgi:hypothetical protein
VDEVPLFQVAKPEQQIGHLQRHRGLARARLAGEAHMQARPGRRQGEPLPGPVDQQQRGGLPDLLLHRDQADQLIVQGGEGQGAAGQASLRPLPDTATGW